MCVRIHSPTLDYALVNETLVGLVDRGCGRDAVVGLLCDIKQHKPKVTTFGVGTSAHAHMIPDQFLRAIFPFLPATPPLPAPDNFLPPNTPPLSGTLVEQTQYLLPRFGDRSGGVTPQEKRGVPIKTPRNHW